MKKPSNPSQLKLKKEIINLIAHRDTHVVSLDLVNQESQVPHPLMVVYELTGESTLTIQLINKKAVKRYQKKRSGGETQGFN